MPVWVFGRRTAERETVLFIRRARARYGRRQISVDEAADLIGVKAKQVDELETGSFGESSGRRIGLAWQPALGDCDPIATAIEKSAPPRCRRNCGDLHRRILVETQSAIARAIVARRLLVGPTEFRTTSPHARERHSGSTED